MKSPKILLPILICLVGFSCTKEEQLPIEKEKMVNILIDIHFAEAAVQHIPGNKKDTVITKYYNQIYEIHGVEKVDFDSTLVLLTSDPNLLKEYYQEVLDSIEIRKAQSLK